MIKMPVVIMLVAVGVLATAAFARSSSKHSAHINSRYLPLPLAI
jgi:hypothetical protein